MVHFDLLKNKCWPRQRFHLDPLGRLCKKIISEKNYVILFINEKILNILRNLYLVSKKSFIFDELVESGI